MKLLETIILSDFFLIYEKQSIDKIIDFVAKGFGMSNEKKRKILHKLLENPDNVPLAAISKSKLGLEIAILLFWQKKKCSSCGLEILNLSSWFALPNRRNIESVFFVKWLTKELNSYILTNYTANEGVKTIFQAFGLVPMQVKQFHFGIIKKNKIKFSSADIKSYFKLNKVYDYKNINKNISHLNNNKGDSCVTYWITQETKFRLKIRVLNLYIAKPDRFLAPSGISLLFLMLRYRAFLIRINISTKSKNDNNNRWLVSEHNCIPNTISPDNSELVILGKK
jgi:hypothetical protein